MRPDRRNPRAQGFVRARALLVGVRVTGCAWRGRHPEAAEPGDAKEATLAGD